MHTQSPSDDPIHRSDERISVARRRSVCMDRENGGGPPLFGLAPCGVCPATAIAGGAVRSYRTFSPLPCPTTATHSMLTKAASVACPDPALTERAFSRTVLPIRKPASQEDETRFSSASCQGTTLVVPISALFFSSRADFSPRGRQARSALGWSGRAVCFLWHFPSAVLSGPPPGRYPAHRSVEFGLSSADLRPQRPSGPAANVIIIDVPPSDWFYPYLSIHRTIPR